MYGLLELDINNKDDFLVNHIIIPGKFYVHKSKYIKVKPRVSLFLYDFLSYTRALKVEKDKNSMELG